MALKQRDYAPDARGTLAGVRVLDLSRLFAGNVLTQILGDFGAEVIKVEPPAGDTLRAWRTKDIQTHWKIYARNKKSLCLELRKPEARKLLLDLVPSAAMFLESFRPGTLEKMGLAPETLLERNPKLVIVRISGFGQDGPYQRRPGFGTLIEGMSGFAAINGFADREPVLPPMYLADGVAGIYGASAAMIALREVEQNGGRGQVIDLPLLDPLFAILEPAGGQLPAHRESEAAHRQPLDQLRAAQRLPLPGREVRRAVGLDAEDGRAHVPRDRPAGPRRRSALPHQRRSPDARRRAGRDHRRVHRPSARRPRTSRSSSRPRSPSARSTTSRRSSRTRTSIERELVADYPDPDMGALPMHHVVPRLAGTPGSIRTPAPHLGEHNRALLREVGVDDAAYASSSQQASRARASRPRRTRRNDHVAQRHAEQALRPGSRPELFGKAMAGEADAISIDLEDAVDESRKRQARAAVGEFLRSLPADKSKTIIVRVNGIATEHFAADVEAIAGPGLDLINVPMTETGDDVRKAAAIIGRIEKSERPRAAHRHPRQRRDREGVSPRRGDRVRGRSGRRPAARLRRPPRAAGHRSLQPGGRPPVPARRAPRRRRSGRLRLRLGVRQHQGHRCAEARSGERPQARLPRQVRDPSEPGADHQRGLSGRTTRRSRIRCAWSKPRATPAQKASVPGWSTARWSTRRSSCARKPSSPSPAGWDSSK